MTSHAIPPIVHLVWVGSEPPAVVLGTVARLRELNPSWDVRLWSESDLGWLRNRALFDAAPTPAGKANIARYEIVHREGGYYVDTDFEFLSPLAGDVPMAGLVVTRERQKHYTNSFFGAPAGHPFLARLVDRLPESTAARPGMRTQMVSGPLYFTDELRAWSAEPGNEYCEIPRDRLFPYSYDKLDRGAGPWAPTVLAVHHWDQARVHAARGPVRPPLHRRLKVRSRARQVARGTRNRVRSALWTPAGLSLGDGQAVIITREGLPLVVSTGDVNVLAKAYAKGSHDEGFQRFLRRTLSGSDVYVDVGANIGQFVVAAARQLDAYGRVYAFEPNPTSAAILRKNAYLYANGGLSTAEVIVRDIALSDEAGHTTLRTPAWHSGRASVSPAALTDVEPGQLESHDVRMSTLDAELGYLSRIRLLKVDVEGHEAAVLRGADELITSGRVDFVDVESVRKHGGTQELAAVLARWQGLGASLHHLVASGDLVPITGPIATALRYGDFGHLVADFTAA